VLGFSVAFLRAQLVRHARAICANALGPADGAHFS